ncbi:sigma factor-like helix-turn-helix DNA-binding protein [Streptomyces sp. NPDC005438]|uniref:sigma factor-like helix-turn-helix DNA-binding protein n=1 Tax=Streptomyces sp. NPDC005438 TaxID=3156880 RepID=UPI0033AE3BE0
MDAPAPAHNGRRPAVGQPSLAPSARLPVAGMLPVFVAKPPKSGRLPTPRRRSGYARRLGAYGEWDRPPLAWTPASAEEAEPAVPEDAEGGRERADRAEETADPSDAARTFDLLYVLHSDALARQCFVLTGNREVAERAVAHAFRLAWERWPEVMRDPDPEGWVRAAAHEYALSPWHRFHPARRRPPGHPGTAEDRRLLEALLALSAPYRRVLLLHDGLGLGLAETAAECEASTAATAGRLRHARGQLVGAVPRLGRLPEYDLRRRIGETLAELGAAQPLRPRRLARVREASERTTRRWTQAAVGLTAAVAVATAVTSVVSPEPFAPPHPAPSADQGESLVPPAQRD